MSASVKIDTQTKCLVFNLYKSLQSLDKHNTYHKLEAAAYKWLFEQKMIGQGDPDD